MSILGGLYRGESAVDFPGLWRRAVIISTVAVLIGLTSFGVRGLNLGLDFEGGTSFEVRSPGTSVAEAREVLEQLDIGDARIQIVDGDVLLIRSDVQDTARAAEIRDVLAAELGPIEAFEQVGPTWGDEVTDKAVRALLVFFVVVALYIAVRLEWKMAVGAMVAVAHDIVLSVGVYSVLQFEITPATVIAFLTIMGYSLYDTIVVYDKVREIVGRLGATDRYTYTELMNLSLNRVAMRSINTSVTSAIVAGLKEREERWSLVFQKVRSRGVVDGPTRVIGRQEAAVSDTRAAPRSSPTGGPAKRRPTIAAPGAGGAPPRPRKKKR